MTNNGKYEKNKCLFMFRNYQTGKENESTSATAVKASDKSKKIKTT